MGGGLLNLVANGNQNIILNGNPTKTFFKCTYAKYTNFGLQKFRIDYKGSRTLRENSESNFSFKVPRYADLLMDTYLVVTLPTIWSPIYQENGNTEYQFKWIKHIGAQMIKRVRFTVGGQTIQEYSGQHMHNMVERDFDTAKKELYYKMIGHVPEIYDPENANGNNGKYPNADFDQNAAPSIRTRKLYIPLNTWFTMASKMAFPLASLQYNELNIEIDIRPICELFVTKHVKDPTTLQPWPEGESDPEHYKPNFNDSDYELYRFLHPPPDSITDSYTDQRTEWNADIHLISTYAFLSEDEVRVFAANEQKYLIKQAYTHLFYDIHGPKKLKIDSMGLVANFTWFFQRSDVNERNEWSNYTNWDHDKFPTPLETIRYDISSENYIYKTGDYKHENEKTIMKSWGLLFDGKYRENVLDVGVLEYIDKYARSSGNGPEGQYFYNFGLRTDPRDFQPTGAVNLNKFKDIEFEIDVLPPPLSGNLDTNGPCTDDGDLVGVNKSVWDLYKYNYTLTVMEERYNILTFSSGNASLAYAR